MGHLVGAFEHGYRALGLDDAAAGDEVFWHLVPARIIEPTSKVDSLRVLDEAGVAPPSYGSVKRRLPAYAEGAWRKRLSAACAAHERLGPRRPRPPRRVHPPGGLAEPSPPATISTRAPAME